MVDDNFEKVMSMLHGGQPPPPLAKKADPKENLDSIYMRKS
jgi:hypothetical protein